LTGTNEKEVQLHSFLTSALDAGEWSASRPGLFIPGETVSGIHLTEGSVGIRDGLRGLPVPEFEPRSDGYIARNLVTVPSEFITSMYHVLAPHCVASAMCIAANCS
jgi:hypothetical protein